MMLAIAEGLGTAIYIGASVLAAGAGTYSAIKSTQDQKKARGLQKNAQQQAQAAVLKQENRATADMKRIRQQQELDVASILAANQKSATPSTMLTNPTSLGA